MLLISLKSHLQGWLFNMDSGVIHADNQPCACTQELVIMLKKIRGFLASWFEPLPLLLFFPAVFSLTYELISFNGNSIHWKNELDSMFGAIAFSFVIWVLTINKVCKDSIEEYFTIWFFGGWMLSATVLNKQHLYTRITLLVALAVYSVVLVRYLYKTKLQPALSK